MRRLIISWVLALGLIFSSASMAPSVASERAYYGDTARSVAKKIGCKQFRVNKDKGDFALSAGICTLKGKRVHVLTFKNKSIQKDWNMWGEVLMDGDFYWATGKGAGVMTNSGNYKTAKIAAKRLPGKIKHGWEYSG